MFLLWLGGGLVTVPVAAKWSLEPSLRTAITLSDNVGLASDENLPAFGKRRQDVISELTPGLWLQGKGRRYSLDLTYRMQNLFYAREKQYDITNHQGGMTGFAELLRNRLFLDVEGRHFQRPIYAHPGIFLEYFLPGDRTDVTTLRISPHFRQNVGKNAHLLVRYTHDQTSIEDRASDSVTRRAFARLANRRWGRVAWSLNYKKERVERADYLLMDHETSQGNFRYRFGRRFALVARAGSENHDLGLSTSWTRQYDNGDYLAGGISWRIWRTLRLDTLYGEHYKLVRTLWNPSRRTSLDLSWRDRDYGMNPGDSWRGEFSLRFRRSVWLTSYQETVVALQQALSERGVYSFRDPETGQFIPGEPDPDSGQLVPVYFDPETGERTEHPYAGRLTPLVLDDFGLFNETYLRKRGQSVFGWQTGENAVTALLFHERRNYLEQGDSALSQGVHASWRHRLNPGRDLLMGINYQQRVYRFTRYEGEVWSVESGLLWELGRGNSASCLYRYLDRSAYSKRNRYHENRITCYLQLRL